MGCQAWVQPLRVMFSWVAYWLPELVLLTDSAAGHRLVAFHTDPNLGQCWFVLVHIPQPPDLALS